jgi:hypothetical protein
MRSAFIAIRAPFRDAGHLAQGTPILLARKADWIYAWVSACTRALPGFGEMKVKALGSVLAKRFGVAEAVARVPAHPTLGDVDSPQALADYQAAKRLHKAEWSKLKPRR